MLLRNGNINKTVSVQVVLTGQSTGLGFDLASEVLVAARGPLGAE